MIHVGGYFMAEKVRVNMNFPLELKQWLEDEAEKNGFNLTTMIQLACMNYRKEQEAIEMSRLVKRSLES